MSKNTIDTFKKIRGCLPEKKDMVDWSDAKSMAFIKFVEFFTNKDQPKHKFNCSPEQIDKATALDEPFFPEFLARINVDHTDAIQKTKPHKVFHPRFLTFSRIPLTWYKQNPSTVTPEMYAVMKQNQRMDWATRHFVEHKNEMGVAVIKDEREELDPDKPNYAPNSTKVKNPEVLFNEQLLEMTKLHASLLKGIKPKDIDSLTVNQKIQHSMTLTKTLAAAFAKYKPNKAVFNQVNINSSGKEELEKIITSFGKTQV